MTYCPSGPCLCRTLQAESARVWTDLSDAEAFGSPLYEETITQTLALTLNRQHGHETRVHQFGKSEEKKNGADFLWLIFDQTLAQNFAAFVQAKRLYPNGHFKAFKQAQAESLVNHARSANAFAVYLAYSYPKFGKLRWAMYDAL